MIQKLLYKNMPKSYHKQISDLKALTTDLDELYKVDTSIQFLVYIKEDKLVSYLAYKDLGNTYDIYNIVTNLDYQNKGIAQQLLNQLNDKDIVLEVKQGNEKAIKFYEKNNFVKQLVKKQYYKDGQDAIVMVKSKDNSNCKL